MLIAAGSVRAQEPTYLEAGSPAPFSGELISSSLARQLLKDRAEAKRLRGVAGVLRADLKKLEADLSTERERRSLEAATHRDSVAAYEEALKRYQDIGSAVPDVPFYKTTVFVVVTTAVVTAALTATIYEALR